jgi:hypothetical protein
VLGTGLYRENCCWALEAARSAAQFQLYRILFFFGVGWGGGGGGGAPKPTFCVCCAGLESMADIRTYVHEQARASKGHMSTSDR